MIILRERALILLTRPEGTARELKRLRKIFFLNRAPRVDRE